MLDHVRWRRLSPLLDRALDLDVGERSAWLEQLRGEDEALAAELEAFLEEQHTLEREGFLAHSPFSAFAQQSSLIGQTIGAYTLEAPLGQGGMGTVWLARRSDGRFEGKVAIKLLNAALVGRAGEERFQREGSILARLTHPNIARLIDAGVSPTGQPYLVLEYVEGERIDSYCDLNRLGVAARLRLFLDVLAAVANGGSLDDVSKGVDFFHQMKQAGNYVPVIATAATVKSGQTSVVFEWDYLSTSHGKDVSDWKIFVPSNATIGGYYAQAINKQAPHPASARLWEEYLYSDAGQNLWLKGGARPVRQAAMDKGGTLDKAAASALPPVTGTPQFPTQDQLTAAGAYVAAHWSAAVS